MKKILVLVSIALMSGCMYALAADTGTMGNNTTTDNAMNQAGTTADNAANTANDTMNTTSETTKNVTTTAKNSKTCVDENGITLKRGEAGFRTCMKNHKQQSGMMGNDSDVNSHTDHTDTNNNAG